MYIYDMDYKGCTSGELWGNLTIKRSAGSYSRLYYRDFVKIGIIGCHESCLTCSGTGPNKCLVC